MSIAHLQSNDLVIDNDRMELLRKTIANEAPPLEFELFVADCNRRGLDPFAKQIYLVPRNMKSKSGQWETKWTAQTSIDGYRLIADRTGKYAGSDEPVYDSEDGKHPNKATVTVWKLVGGQRVSFSSSARWDEYCQTTKDGNPSGLWNKMPYVMLAKCAESAALRKAFPQELSGLYTNEEMQQADTPQYLAPVTNERIAIADQSTGEIIEHDDTADRERASKRLFAIIGARGITDDERHAMAWYMFKKESFKDLTADEMAGLAESIEKRDDRMLKKAIAECVHRYSMAHPIEITIESAPDRARAPKQSDVDAQPFDPESATAELLERLAAATTQEEVQAIGRNAAAMGLHSEELTKAMAAAFLRFRADDGGRDGIPDMDKPLKLA